MNILDRTKSPKIKDYTDFELVLPHSIPLQNGITVKQFDNNDLDLIHFQLKIKAGSCYEPKKNVAAFCYLLLKESAPQHDIYEVDEFLDYYGVNYSVSISIEYVTISIVIPKNNCLIALPYIFDFLLHPHFKETYLQLLQDRKIKDLAVNKEKVGYCASQLMLHQLFGNSCLVGKYWKKAICVPSPPQTCSNITNKVSVPKTFELLQQETFRQKLSIVCDNFAKIFPTGKPTF